MSRGLPRALLTLIVLVALAACAGGPRPIILETPLASGTPYVTPAPTQRPTRTPAPTHTPRTTGTPAAVATVLALNPAGKVNINEADVDTLDLLPHIGPALAQRIVDYRQRERTAATKAGKPKWNFDNWATLMKVSGVGPEICKDNLNVVCFSGKVQKSCPK